MKKVSNSYRWVIQPLLVVGILVFGFLVAMSFSMFEEEPRKSERAVYAPLVRVFPTQEAMHRIQVQGNGTVQARTRINVVAQVGGRITYIQPNLRAGGTFKANEVLLEVERIDYELAVTQNEAQVAAARTALELEIAEATAAREEWVVLNPERAVPALVAREPQIAQARAELKSAKARLARSRLDLQRTRVRMPFHGRVVESSIDVGEVIAANQSIGTVYSNEQFEIPVPLALGQLVWIDATAQGGSTAKIKVTIGEREYELPGRVTRIEGELQERSRFARVIVTLLSKDIPDPLKEEVIPGLFVDVSIASQQKVPATLLPRSSLREGKKLWVVDQGQLKTVPAEIVYQSEKEIYVRNLMPGTQIVTSGLEVVTEGMKVRTADDEA